MFLMQNMYVISMADMKLNPRKRPRIPPTVPVLGKKRKKPFSQLANIFTNTNHIFDAMGYLNQLHKSGFLKPYSDSSLLSSIFAHPRMRSR